MNSYFQETFKSVQSWIRELQTHLKDKTVLAIAGNKSDLVDKREVTTKGMIKFELDLEPFFTVKYLI